MKKISLPIFVFLVISFTGFAQNLIKQTNNYRVSRDFPVVQESVVVHPTVVKTAIDFGITPPLRDLAPATELTPEQMEEKELLKDEHELNTSLKDRYYPFPSAPMPDPVWQKTMGTKDMNPSKAPLLNFAGQASGYYPSDCNGAAGPNHYMQGVNSTYAIYNKSGTQVVPPTNFNTLFSGVTGATYNDGDIIVLYDEMADRWFVSEFSISGSNDYMLIAVSTTNDPTGTWYKWSFDVADMPDYMKFGIWEDGYYMADNNTTGNDIYVFERSVMLAGGASPQMVAFNNPNRPNSGFHCIMPLDCDGTYAPAGTPGQFITINDGAWGGTDQLWIYECDVNWASPASSTFARVQQLNVSAFDSNFGVDWANIAQLGTSQEVDAIPQILMFRAQYRNFGGSQAIVCAHTVDVDGTDHAGIRWYELQNTGATWSIRQQGTYAPDAHSRWLPSIAMDMNHNIGIGYNISSSSMNPGIRYTGQTAAENALASGIFDVTEEVIQNGTQSQTATDRWGDYGEMCLDPVNDITFWFTTEYYNSGKKTKIATFQFTPTKPYTNFAINTPVTLLQPVTILAGEAATYVDLTVGSVNSWLWNFQGGSPGSASTQNSPSITYNTPGSYDVTLTATNAQGDSTLTKYDYIRVIDPASLFCDTMVQFYGNPTIYTSTGGYVGGTNEYGCSAIAEKFENYHPYSKITGGRFYWAQATNGTSPDVTFVVWGNNGGSPGTQLATKTISLSSIVSDYNTDGFTDVTFDSDVILPTGPFFLGFFVPGSAVSGDTLAIVTNNESNGTDDTGYSLYSGWETYAAWGLSLMDAIFPFGCYDPFIPPVADFSGTPLQLPAGNTVSFTDESYGSTPTSWSWTFSGGTPPTSASQNPVITYNTPGVYPVSLTVSNANGSDIETKNGYVEVLDPNSCTCGQFCNVVGSEVLYTTGSGYVSGNNQYGDEAKAEYFGSYAPYNRLEGAWFSFGAVYVNNPATNITFNVWNNTGAGGSPGTVIGTKTVNIATIANDVANGDSTWVAFNPPVNLTTPFYLGFIIPSPTGGGDSLGLRSGAMDSGTPNTAWERWSGGTWYAYSDASSWGGDWNLAIYPTICTTGAPIPDFIADNTTMCNSGTVTFTDISTCGPTSWNWSFPGGTPATATGQGPHTVSYSAPGTYDVSLQISNAQGSNTKYKTGFINVTPPPAIVMSGTNETSAGACDGTATATPSGNPPFSYIWDVTNSNSASFTGAGGQIQDNTTNQYFNQTVSGIGTVLNGTTTILDRVCITIDHDRGADLDIYLHSPDATIVMLSTDNGGTGNGDFNNVCFEISAATLITAAGNCPISGTYRPEGNLANFNNGQNPNGQWRIEIDEDNGQGGNGSLTSWTLYFTTISGVTSQTATDLCNGTYNVTVTDANGCTNTGQITLP
ncbi:MAG: PKD domain-containing protein, partial [Bacteroidota bacterium]